MSCILRAFGSDFRPDDFLQHFKLEPFVVFYKGRPIWPKAKPKGKKHLSSGFNCEVSRKGFANFSAQRHDALTFLRQNKRWLRALVRHQGVEGVYLDFGIERRAVAVQCDYFPPELLRAAGECGIGIELSQYPAPPKGGAKRKGPPRRKKQQRFNPPRDRKASLPHPALAKPSSQVRLAP